MSNTKNDMPILDAFLSILEGLFNGFIELIEWLLKDKLPEGYTAEFVSADDVLKSSNTGFVVNGKQSLSMEDSFTNLLISAPTGMGKSVISIFPNILSAQASMIVHDPSSELIKGTSQLLYEQGTVVQSFNPCNASISIGYNPLAHAHSDTDIEKIADTLVRISLKGESKDPFWGLMAKSVIVFCIKMLKKIGNKEHYNMASVRQLLFEFSGNGKKMDALVVKYADDAMLSEYRSYLSYGKALGSIIATAQAATHIFSDTEVQKVTSYNTFNFQDLRKQKITLFINNSVTDIAYYAPLTALFLQQCFEYTLKDLPSKDAMPILYVIDEASSLDLGRENFPVIISNIRKFKSGLLLAFQSAKEQLTQLYGREGADTILQNCMSQLYMSGQALETSQYLERLIGKRTFEDDKGNKKNRELITSDEIRSMDKREAIFIHSNSRPMKVKLYPYFEQRRFRHIGKLPMLNLQNPTTPSTVSIININKLTA